MQLACLHCDHIIDIPPLNTHQVAICPCCKSKLSSAQNNNDRSVIALSLSAIIMLLSSVFYPFIAFSSNGLTQMITLPDAARILVNYENVLLGVLLDMSIIGLPLLMLLLLIPLHMGVLNALPTRYARRLLKFTFGLKPWVMSEIFIVGVLVSMVKIMSLAQISFGLSFWAYIAFVILYVSALSHTKKERLWQQVAAIEAIPQQANPPSRAIDADLRACHVCHQLTPLSQCPRCYSPTHLRSKRSVQKTLAWLITAVMLYFPANILPIMYTTTLGDKAPSTLIGGVIHLWEAGSYPIAIIIFSVSVVIPLAKSMVLALLCYLVYQQPSQKSVKYTRLYQITEFIGKWSMIDVFVVAILVSLVQLGNLMSITPGLGTLCFAAMVVCQMISAHAFDPRLIWDTPAQKLGAT